MFLETLYRLLGACSLSGRSQMARAVSRFAYFRYKRYIEDPFLKLTREHREIFNHGHVIDVGANLGYTTRVFSRAVGEGFSVIAFEPDATNFASMVKDKPNIVPIQAAVGRESGVLRLWHNRANPADHRIVTDQFGRTVDAKETTPVRVMSIDEYLATNTEIGADARISFCKIDVQGYESEVLRGMRRTIESNPDITLAVEYCPWIMRELGLDDDALFDELNRHGFKYYLLRRRRPLITVTPQRLRRLVRPHGYADIICTRRAICSATANVQSMTPTQKARNLVPATRI